MFDRSNYKFLSDKDKVCAQSIEYYSSEIPALSIHQLAAKLYISPASLSRLVKKLGYENYKDFRNSFIVSDNEQNTLPVGAMNGHLNDIFSNYSNPVINTVIPAICGAETTFVLAFGGTTGIGQELVLSLNTLNHYAILIPDSDFVPQLQKMSTTKDLIIYISYSGENQEMNDLALSLQYTNHQILFTSCVASSLSRKVSLIINTHTDALNLQYQSRLPLCCLINVLISNLYELSM